MKFEECYYDIVDTISDFISPLRRLEIIDDDFNPVELADDIFIRLGNETDWFHHDNECTAEIYGNAITIDVTAKFYHAEKRIGLSFSRGE